MQVVGTRRGGGRASASALLLVLLPPPRSPLGWQLQLAPSMVTLQELPAEVNRPGQPTRTKEALLNVLLEQLLLHIHLLSLSPSLPHVSHHLSSLFSFSSSTHCASYLLARHPRSTLSHAIKYSLCTLPVLHELERLSAAQGKKKLKCGELPRRLVKGLGQGEEVDLAMIEYLLGAYEASPNSKKGYFLARAVVARHEPLIRLLLSHGADPGMKEGWAVVQAIGFGDLALVKLLMERQAAVGEVEEVEEFEVLEVVNGKKKRRRSSEGGGGKRRKMEERCEATSAMLEAAVRGQKWDIVDYLQARGVFSLQIDRGVVAKRSLTPLPLVAGARPNIEVLQLLG